MFVHHRAWASVTLLCSCSVELPSEKGYLLCQFKQGHFSTGQQIKNTPQHLRIRPDGERKSDNEWTILYGLCLILQATQSGALPLPLTWKHSIAPEIVQLARNLMKSVKPNRVLAVGVFTGLSLVGAATAISNRSLVIGLEYPEYLTYWRRVGNKYAQQAGIMTKIQLKAEFPIPDTLEQLSRVEPGSFDFILLDDIAQENYLFDYERCLVLLRSGGILLINDVFMEGSVLSGPSMRSLAARTVAQMNRKLQSDSRVISSFIPIGGGLILLYKK